ncbi:MAG: hypothetical protein OEL89_04065, partial [Candidatus Peregrinibacteria bacterium]|nr:hypothetical protein [Candidatus Peregrinibacteria bacterium]
IFVAFLAQVVGLAAALLAVQNEKQKKAKSFFHHPEHEKVAQKAQDVKSEKTSLFDQASEEKEGVNNSEK